MAREKKLVQKMLNRPGDMMLEEINRVLTSFGYDLFNQRGSHSTYVNNLGQQIVVVATNGRIVTKNYIKRVVDLLNLEEWYNEQEPE